MTAVSFDILGRDKASHAFDKVSKSAEKTERRFGFLAARSHGLTAGMTAGFGKIAGAMAAVATVSVFKGFIDEARESRKVGALTESIIKSTGGAAKISAKQVGDLATAISNKTGVDDEAIQSGANLLLTFKNVRNEVGKGANIFDRATQAAVDLSAAGFGDVAGASKMLGKALNDPLKGITALGRAGVTFTEDQKKQIATLVETGRTLEAQKIILKEVESQVGGAAAAAADPMAKLGVIIGNVKETIGTAFLPIIDRAATFLGNVLPPTVKKAQLGVSGLIAAFQGEGVTSDGFVGLMEHIGVAARGVVDAFKGLGKKVVSAIGPIDVVGIGKGILDDAAGWAKNLIGGFKTGLERGDWKPLGKAIGEGLTSAVRNIGAGTGKLADALGSLINKIDWGKLGTKISTGIQDLLKSIDWGKLGASLGDAVVTIFQKTQDLGGKIGKAFKAVVEKVDWKQIGRDSTNAIGEFVTGVDWGRVAKVLGEAVLGSLKIEKQVYDSIIHSAGLLAQGVLEVIIEKMGEGRKWVVQKTKELGSALWAGLKSGIVSAGKGIGAWLKSTFVDPVISSVKSFFGVRSPSTVFAAIGRELLAGFKGGIASAARGIGTWLYRTVIVPVVMPFTRAGAWLVSHGRNFVAGFKGGAATIASGIGRWVYDRVIVPSVRPFALAGRWLGRAGRDLIGGLIGGISTRMKGIGSWIKANVVDPMVSAVKRFFGIRSPSKVFEGIGGHLIGGLLKGMGTGMGSAVAKKVFGDMPSALRAIVGKGLVSVANLPKRALDALGSAVGIGQPIGGPAGNQSNVGVVRTLAAQYGWASGAQWSALYNLIMGESGFRNTAQNPTSSAYGLFQFLDSTWGTVGATKTSDPWQQTIAGLRYIARSYGSPANAYAKWSSRSPHWYEKGTPWVPNDQLAFLHRGEAVIPAEVNRRLRTPKPANRGDIHIHLHGTEQQLMDQLMRKLDDLRRQGRLRVA